MMIQKNPCDTKPIPSRESFELLCSKREDIIAEAMLRSQDLPKESSQTRLDADKLNRSGLGFTLSAIITAIQFDLNDILNFQIGWGVERIKFGGALPEQVVHRFQILIDAIEHTLPAANALEVNQFFSWLICEQENSNPKGR